MISVNRHIRNCSLSVLQPICEFLDPGPWRKLAINVNHPLCKDEPLFSNDYISNLERERSPTEKIIRELSFKNGKVIDLIEALKRSGPEMTRSLAHLLSKCTDACSLEKELAHENNTMSTTDPPSFTSDTSDGTSSGTQSGFEGRFDRPPSQILEEGHPGSSACKLPISEAETFPELEGVTSYSYSVLRTATDNFNYLPLHKGGRVIGQGGFGTVFYGKIDDIAVPVAIKRLDKEFRLDIEDIKRKQLVIKQFKSEISNFCRIKHKNILPVYGCSMNGEHLCLIYKYISGGSLDVWLACRKKHVHLLSVRERLRILLGVACGIKFMHESGIVHRDIKSANILLERDSLVPRIGDFGLAKGGLGPMQTSAQTSVVLGTAIYMPPEAYLEAKVSPEWDCYSFGIVILECLTGYPPTNDKDDKQSIKHVLAVLVDDDEADLDVYKDTRVEWRAHVVKTLCDMHLALTENRRRRRMKMNKATERLSDALTVL